MLKRIPARPLQQSIRVDETVMRGTPYEFAETVPGPAFRQTQPELGAPTGVYRIRPMTFEIEAVED